MGIIVQIPSNRQSDLGGINTCNATSITYTLYDNVGTGDAGSSLHFCITGRI